MKKSVTIIVVLIMLLILFGCTHSPEDTSNSKNITGSAKYKEGMLFSERNGEVQYSRVQIMSDKADGAELNVEYCLSDNSFTVFLEWYPAEVKDFSFDGVFQSGYIKGNETVEINLPVATNASLTTYSSYGLFKSFSSKSDVQALFPTSGPIECYLVGKSGMQDVSFTIPAVHADQLRSWISTRG